jgi:Uma2 family endonuclease
MPGATKYPPVLEGVPIYPLGIAAYHALGEMGLLPQKTELLYGIVYTQMPKSPLHVSLIRILVRLLQPLIPAGYILSIEQPIECGDSEPEPDLSVVRGREEDFFSHHPTTAELAIEVCVTSHEYDRGKIAAYAAAGVAEVWLVLGPERQIEVHREPMDGAYRDIQKLGPDGSVSSVSIPALSMNLSDLFVAVS